MSNGDVVFLSSSQSFQLVTSDEATKLPFPPPDSRTRHVTEFLEDRVIVCDGGHGQVYEQSCYQLSPNCSGWIASSREARFQSASASDGKRMFIMGGYEHPDSSDELVSVDSIEAYNPEKGYWSMMNWSPF